jgi:hypothetical protein
MPLADSKLRADAVLQIIDLGQNSHSLLLDSGLDVPVRCPSKGGVPELSGHWIIKPSVAAAIVGTSQRAPHQATA